MTEAVESDPKPATGYFANRAGTPEDREAAFEAWHESHVPYFAAFAEHDYANTVPWFEDPERCAAVATRLGLPEDTPPDDVRRALWFRRYTRPAPPAGMPLKSLADINITAWQPATPERIAA